jgi:hypothetical protein
MNLKELKEQNMKNRESGNLTRPRDHNIFPSDNLQMYDWLRDGEHPNGGHGPCHLPWVMVNEEFEKKEDWPYQEMLEEAKALDKQNFIPKYNDGNNIGWGAVALYGLSSDSTLPPEEYGYANYNEARAAGALDWTDISEKCPISTKFFKENFNYKRYNRIRFMKVEPGGFIRWHNDIPEGEDPMYPLAVHNMALNNPDNCFFWMGMWGIMPVKAGSIWNFANEHYHCVVNDSDEVRYHMIVSGTPDENFWAPVVSKSFREQSNGIYLEEIDGEIKESNVGWMPTGDASDGLYFGSGSSD